MRFKEAIINNSQTQKGSAHAIIVVVLVVALVGSLGFIFWQNLSSKESVETNAETTAKYDETDKQDVGNEEVADNKVVTKDLKLTLNSKEVSVNVNDSKYTDIVAVFNEANGYYDVYSKDLLAHVNRSNGKSEDSISGCNSTVVVDTYPADDVSGQYNKVGEANGKFVHAGFRGPCDPSSDEMLSNEMSSFRDYVVSKVEQALN